MSDEPWSDHPNAPRIPRSLYLAEKEVLAGDFIGAILYGIATALFFRCTVALLNPVDRAGGRIQWWLVAHTVAMFIFLTLPVAIGLDEGSIRNINNRKFPGNDDYPPGPLGYNDSITYEVTITVFNAMFPLNQWLSDGFLLYRCFIIYSKNYWAIAFPCLLYLASIATGVAHIYTFSRSDLSVVTWIGTNTSYYSICLALNALLTGMIVVRLTLHRRNFQQVMGSRGSSSGPYTTIITIIVESYALYAVALLMYIVPSALNSWVESLFRGVGIVQVIAPYLITIRVANRRALTSEMVSSGSSSLGSIQFGRIQGTTEGDGSLTDEGNVGSAELSRGMVSREPGPEVNNDIKEVPR